MITRTWHGIVPIEKADAFAEYLNETGVAEASMLPGSIAQYVHRVEQRGCTHFFLCTVWADWKSILAFAGDDPAVAVTYEQDDAYGLVSDPIVIHQVVDTAENPFTHTFY